MHTTVDHFWSRGTECCARMNDGASPYIIIGPRGTSGAPTNGRRACPHRSACARVYTFFLHTHFKCTLFFGACRERAPRRPAPPCSTATGKPSTRQRRFGIPAALAVEGVGHRRGVGVMSRAENGSSCARKLQLGSRGRLYCLRRRTPPRHSHEPILSSGRARRRTGGILVIMTNMARYY